MKYLKETTGKLRPHKIQLISEVEQPIINEGDEPTFKFIAEIFIYNEGIDGNYIIEVPSPNTDEAIDYLKTLSEYENFEIVIE